MVKCKQTWKHKCTFTILISSWRCSYSRTRLQVKHLESFAKKTDIPMSGPAVKNHGWPKTGRNSCAKRKISNPLWSLDCRQVFLPVRPPHRCRRTQQVCPQVQQHREVKIKYRETDTRTDVNSTKSKNKNKKQNDKKASGNRLRDLPPWLEEFTENLEEVETHVPAHDSQNSDSERSTKVVPKSRKHSIYTHFPKDRNCNVCLGTRITRAPCRRRTGDSLPRATEFGDVITADHKVLNEEGESRNNHRYAVVVQGLGHSMDPIVSVQNKNSQETERSLQKFLKPKRKPKVIYTGNSLEVGKVCEELSWNHRTSTPYRSETNGIGERAVRRVKESTSAALLQSGLDEKWWLILWNAIAICELFKTSWQTDGYPSKNGRCSQIIENSKIGVSRHLDSSTTTQMAKIMVQYGRPSRSSWNEFVRSSFGRTIMGKGNLRKSNWSTVGRRFLVGNAYSYTVKKGCSHLCMWMTSNWLERNKILIRCGKYSIKMLNWENQHLFLIMFTWDVLKDNVK